MDYYYAENEGHIFVKLTVTHNMCLQEGDRFIQGLLVEHGITKNDNILNDERTGGFGSTGK